MATTVITHACRSSLSVRATHRPSEKLIYVGLSFYPGGWGGGTTRCMYSCYAQAPLQRVFSILESYVRAWSHAILTVRNTLKTNHGHDHGLLAVRPNISGLSIRDFEHLRLGGGTSRADAVVSRATGGSERFGLHAKGCNTGGG